MFDVTFLSDVEDLGDPASEDAISAFESEIGRTLPEDYRYFLTVCNGGCLGGLYWYGGAGVHHIGGLRDDAYYSLRATNKTYGDRIPRELLWVMDDPFGNAICVGLDDEFRGKVYFWDHEEEPFEDEWDGSARSADNVHEIAESFATFVAGLERRED